MAATPPTGYTIPAAAAQLLATAQAAGWRTLTSWTPPAYQRAPFLTVRVGLHASNGGIWHYRLTWHSRGCAPGHVRLFSSVARTPGHPAWHNGPSLKAIRAVIAQNPNT
ncbi:hypothetical protein [Streptomyces sp. NPDC056169]|uniref:hypothetical protein n=1 Tax=Streptomyces sp. NPDC056169 TaxID=3345734 RepID=UPI0035E115AD